MIAQKKIEPKKLQTLSAYLIVILSKPMKDFQ
jgi:hypothetical protein